ncbi:MAG: bifunctional DNA-formamidopyrimidine glycosylase/DNA-(apurinic or apyrimidinic site) lyase [Planctomycetes bacterium]|nr:bifunctional DNA-formamidopyrimidine glycosylase/DNA-(apurinic or apyrimidinic site) lyase [Planctomycetota bacterium]
MPELPEVETVVRDLRPLLLGRSFVKIAVSRKSLRRKWSRAWEATLLDRCVHAIRRRGKWIVIELGIPCLVAHLGMTGQLTVASADQPREAHTHVVFTLDDQTELRFRDVRRFGSVTVFPTMVHADRYFLQISLGPEPFDLTDGRWFGSLNATRRNLKAILLDQTIVAGVGNIYADESLFEARLHPTTLGNAVTRKQAKSLRLAMVAVLTRAIEKRGSSIRDYIGGSGLKGEMQNEFRVYGRTGEPCRRCRTTIVRIVLAGRSTHYCPRCQVLGTIVEPQRLRRARASRSPKATG